MPENQPPAARLQNRTIAWWVIAGVGVAISIAAMAFTASTLGPPSPPKIPQALLNPLKQPSPQLEPDQVVRIQLDALGAAALSDDGILQCYQFASPANRRATGPLPRFVAMIRSGPYAAMLHQTATRIGRPVVRGEHARVLATLVDNAGRVRVYQFELSRQTTEPYVDCWMTDSVLEVLSDRAPDHAPAPKRSGPAV